MRITKQQILRYKKQIALPGIGLSGQQKIQDARVLVIGAGGLGAPILYYLAAAGIGILACMDFDQLELHNLHRQIIHREDEVGNLKVQSAAKQLGQLNSGINFIPIALAATVENIDAYVRNYDIIIDGSDNFETRYAVNDSCCRQQKPLVYGSILNFEAQMAVFNQNKGKDLRALFPEPPDPTDVPSCELNGVLGTVPGVLGTMMAQECLKIVLGLPGLHNEFLLIDTLAWEIKKLKF